MKKTNIYNFTPPRYSLTRWQKFLRRFKATPYLSIDDNYYVLMWYYKNGRIDVEKCGHCEPGGFIEMPKGTKVIRNGGDKDVSTNSSRKSS